MDILLVIPIHERLLGVLNLLRSVTSQQLHNKEIEIIVASNLHDPKLERAIQKLNLIFPVHYTFSGIVGGEFCQK
jgi:beta-phosphoglucomutase-like phosphatase (HAD superfamily)